MKTKTLENKKGEIMKKETVISGLIDSLGDDRAETALEKAFSSISGEVLLASVSDPLTDGDSFGEMEVTIIDTLGASRISGDKCHINVTFGIVRGVYVVGAMVNTDFDFMAGEWEFFIGSSQKELAEEVFGGVNFED